MNIIVVQDAHHEIILAEVTSQTPNGVHALFKNLWRANVPDELVELAEGEQPKETWFSHGEVLLYDASQEDFLSLIEARRQVLAARGQYNRIVQGFLKRRSKAGVAHKLQRTAPTIE